MSYNTAKNNLLEGYFIEQTAKKMKQGFAKELLAHKIGITVDQWIILDTLAIEDNISQLHLAEKTSKDSPTVTRILDLLEKKKLIQRNADLTDRRRFKISLSNKGNRLIKKVTPLGIAYRASCYKGISSTELTSLKKTLNTISKNLQNK